MGSSVACMAPSHYLNQCWRVTGQFNPQEWNQLNSSLPAAYIRQWTGSALVQIMACRLFGAKPLSKPINTVLLSIGPLGTNFSEILIKIQNVSFTKIHLKMPSAKWRPFVNQGGGGGGGGVFCSQHCGRWWPATALFVFPREIVPVVMLRPAIIRDNKLFWIWIWIWYGLDIISPVPWDRCSSTGHTEATGSWTVAIDHLLHNLHLACITTSHLKIGDLYPRRLRDIHSIHPSRTFLTDTIDSRYIAVKYNTMLYILQRLRRQNFGQTSNSWKTAIPRPNGRVMAALRELLRKSDREISGVRCINSSQSGARRGINHIRGVCVHCGDVTWCLKSPTIRLFV